MALGRIVRFIWTHPLGSQRRLGALADFARWQIGMRLLPGSAAVVPFAGARLVVERGMAGATGNVYVGLHEFDDMGFLLHLLRPGDLFVDVGANVGSYTILASAVAGARALSFEPIPETFARLETNIAVNSVCTLVRADCRAVGGAGGRVSMTSGLDAMNHVLRNDGAGPSANRVEREVVTLDAQLEKDTPILLKIDVEGFEHEVLRGAKTVLLRDLLLAVILELNGSGERYGWSDSLVHEEMLDFGFRPFRYDPFSRRLHALDEASKTGNTLYIRGAERVLERVRSASPFTVKGIQV